MTIAGDYEAPIRSQDPSPDFNSCSGLRHRRPPPAPVASESFSSKSSPPTAEITVTSSGEESSVETASSDLSTGDAAAALSLEGEKAKPVKATSDRGAGKDDEGRGAGGGMVPANFMYRAAAPAHRKVKESPLSSDAIFQQMFLGGMGNNVIVPYFSERHVVELLLKSPKLYAWRVYTMITGVLMLELSLLNLCIVVLIAVNSRLIIENLMKYGLLIRAGFWFSSNSLRNWPLVMCCLTLPAFPVGAFMIEKLAYHKYISKLLVIFLQVLLTTAAILYPVYVILRYDSAVLSGFTLMFVASILWLKLVSYAHTNYDMRTISEDKEELSFIFPDLADVRDISFRSLVYFMLAPTLCYQPHYPRTTCVRKNWLIRQLVKCVIFTGLMGFIIEQYINPIVKNSQHPLKGDLLHALERILKLSVPTLYVWLCMFYCFFHLWLNILAELLCFGDREFYKDWWNAKTIEEYWRMWNMPVHKWMIRHIYFPCLRNGIPKGVAVLISFFVSAIFHEICIAVPCHIFKFWAFIGIMFQVPLVILTKYLQNKFRNTMVGNMIFWFFFSILGQPMCVLLYYHDVMNRKVMNE